MTPARHSKHEQGDAECRGRRRPQPDGASILVGGFGRCGIPENLIAALRKRRHRAGLPLTAAWRIVAEGKETRELNRKPYVLENPLHADFALINSSYRGDRLGNSFYWKTARHFEPRHGDGWPRDDRRG